MAFPCLSETFVMRRLTDLPYHMVTSQNGHSGVAGQHEGRSDVFATQIPNKPAVLESFEKASPDGIEGDGKFAYIDADTDVFLTPLNPDSLGEVEQRLSG